MFGTFLKGLGLLAIGALVYLPLQGATNAASSNVGYIAVGSRSLVPYGWVDFCHRYKGECEGGSLPSADANLTPETMKIIKQVNAWVNTNIKPMSDTQHWGVVDQWDYPTDGFGDCEDYVLLKRRLLIDEGLPKQALLVTVVKDEHGEGHSILTVKTNRGEYILDNLATEVKPWNQVPYRFVKRQSQTDQNIWVDIGEPTSAPLTVSR
jgi:predicted transglutaminase-like cysteine proteinase